MNILIVSILQVIATLCLTPTGNSDIRYVAKVQLKCQQSYITCVENNYKSGYPNTDGAALRKCIMEKE